MFRSILLTLAATVCLASQASAALVYQMSFDANASSLLFNTSMNLGDTQTFGVYLHELFIVGTDTPRIGNNPGDNGLITANFAVNRASGTTNISGAAGNGLFDLFGGPTVNFNDFSATVEQEVDVISDPVVASTSAAGRRTIQIGSITVNAMTAGTTLFDLQDFSLGDDLVIGDGISPAFVADGSTAFGQLSVSVTAVPEPSSLALVGLIGLTGLMRRRRV